MGKFYVINSCISGYMNFMQQKQDRKKTDKKKKRYLNSGWTIRCKVSDSTFSWGWREDYHYHVYFNVGLLSMHWLRKFLQ